MRGIHEAANNELVVLLDGMVAGFAARSRRGEVHFSYSDGYLPSATPLSVSVDPAASGTHRIADWLDGLLPDSPEMRSHWARRLRSASTEPFDLLSTRAGWECAGAVQFCKPAELGRRRDEPGTVHNLTEGDVALALDRLADDFAPTAAGQHPPGHGFAFSLAGAQPKLALRHENGRWAKPSGPEPTTHILKPPGLHLTERIRESVHINEHLCMSAARRLGVSAARTSLADFDGNRCLVIERFDRRLADGRWRRIHSEDLCQAMGLPPAAKYQADGGPGPEQIVELLRRVGTEGDDRRFVEALFFNWLIAGTDAHAKNYSLLLHGRAARLAPVYDVISYAPYAERPDGLHSAMWIGGDRPFMPESADDWRRAGSLLGAAIETSRLHEIAAGLRGALAEAAAECPDWATDTAHRTADQIAAWAGRRL